MVLGRVRMHGSAKPRTFLRATGELTAGQTDLDVEAEAAGWERGDRLLIPDSRQLRSDERSSGYTALEVVTLAQAAVGRPHAVLARSAHHIPGRAMRTAGSSSFRTSAI